MIIWSVLRGSYMTNRSAALPAAASSMHPARQPLIPQALHMSQPDKPTHAQGISNGRDTALLQDGSLHPLVKLRDVTHTVQIAQLRYLLSGLVISKACSKGDMLSTIFQMASQALKQVCTTPYCAFVLQHYYWGCKVGFDNASHAGRTAEARDKSLSVKTSFSTSIDQGSCMQITSRITNLIRN